MEQGGFCDAHGMRACQCGAEMMTAEQSKLLAEGMLYEHNDEMDDSGDAGGIGNRCASDGPRMVYGLGRG